MKDIDIDNTIENANSEKKEELRAQLHARLGLPQQEATQTTSRRRVFSLKAVALGIAAMCAVCLAIVLPITLRNNTPARQQVRFKYSFADFTNADLGLTIKEYSAQTGKNILYLDWYDNINDCVTKKYFLPNKQNDIIFVSEDLYDGEMGDRVHFDVVGKNIYIDELEIAREACSNNYKYNNTNIHWAHSDSASRAYFEYKGYKYYVRLDDPMSEQAILDIVKEML